MMNNPKIVLRVDLSLLFACALAIGACATNEVGPETKYVLSSVDGQPLPVQLDSASNPKTGEQLTSHLLSGTIILQPGAAEVQVVFSYLLDGQPIDAVPVEKTTSYGPVELKADSIFILSERLRLEGRFENDGARLFLRESWPYVHKAVFAFDRTTPVTQR
jgi:hypothetical protein